MVRVCAAFGVSDWDLVKIKIEEHCRHNYYDAGNKIFFIAAEGETSRQLAAKICLGDKNEIGATSGMVPAVTNF